jgi:hypothetical protein
MIRILKDPDSAKFADLFASRGSPRIICGLINAKNGYGGYTGMTPFTYYADTDRVVIAQGLSNGETIRALKTWQGMPPLQRLSANAFAIAALQSAQHGQGHRTIGTWPCRYSASRPRCRPFGPPNRSDP